MWTLQSEPADSPFGNGSSSKLMVSEDSDWLILRRKLQDPFSSPVDGNEYKVVYAGVVGEVS